MNTKNNLSLMGIIAVMSFSPGVFAEDAATSESAAVDTASKDAQHADKIYELLKSGAFEINDRGELVVKKSVTDMLLQQGRLKKGTTTESIICEAPL